MSTTVHAKHGGANVHLPPPLVFLGAILVGVALQYFVPVALGLPLPLRILAGSAVAVAGLGLGGWAFGLFKKSGQDPAPWMPSPSLVAQGPYRFSRNPMYVGMTSLVAGLGLALGNPWMIGLAAVALGVVHFTAVLPEERYLTEKFGADYEQLRKSVRRYL
jgi:protein-S-isoprenylcysteine O-methyltransferase Ste14